MDTAAAETLVDSSEVVVIGFFKVEFVLLFEKLLRISRAFPAFCPMGT